MEIVISKSKLKVTSYTLSLVAIILAISVIMITTPSGGGVSVSAQDLREEFNGAYLDNLPVTGNVVEFNLEASEGELEIFDGYKTKVWNYNGTVPGPELRIKLGDTIRVNFTNNLPEETTIHWHGVRVPNAMDGVPGVTQDPIQPEESFIYEFTPKDPGTFWFHPHVRGSEQVERGLFGILIVEDEYSELYSQDVTWVLDDWRLMDDYQIDPSFNTGHDLSHDGRWGNVITVNGVLNESMEVRPGERIRLRLINTSNARIYVPSFGSLDAKIIAVDGMYVKNSFNASGFELSPGNRIDVDIKIPTESTRVQFSISDNFSSYSNNLGTIQLKGEMVLTPDFEYPSNDNIPDWEKGAEVSIDKEYKLNARRGGTYGIEWTINGKAYPDYDPFELKYDKFNKIKFTNQSYRLHPMHLHGQFFKVLTRNGVAVDEPYLRDTVLIHSQETVEIGLVPLDKGEWVNHCHILEHAEAGMLTVVKVK